MGFNSCKLTIEHVAVVGGTVIGGPGKSYSTSQFNQIIIQPNTGSENPMVQLAFKAYSRKGLIGIKFHIERRNPSNNNYEHVENGNGYEYAITNVGGQLVYATNLIFNEYNGNPIFLNLSHSSIYYDIRLEVTAIERDGKEKVITARYCLLDMGRIVTH
jgi:hypothetical protein